MTGTFEQTFVRISELLGSKISDPTVDPRTPLSCVDAATTAPVWAPNILRTIQFHRAGFPGYDQAAAMRRNIRRRSVEHPQLGEKVAFYEGPQIGI